jgi:hypothetical protein
MDKTTTRDFIDAYLKQIAASNGYPTTFTGIVVSINIQVKSCDNSLELYFNTVVIQLEILTLTPKAGDI